MVMLKALEAAINEVETIHDHEFTFEVDGHVITLRPLRSHEETEVQRYAQVAWEGVGDDGDTAAYQEFMDRVRVSTLGFSIVRLGDMDLHDVEWIESDEVDETTGQVVHLPKWEAVRDLIRRQWSKPVALQVFAKFGELLERVEITASKLVKFDPSDLDEEIERVKKRLAGLEKKREEYENAEPPASSVEKAQKAVADVDQRNRRVRSELRNTAAPEPRQSVQEEAPPQPRQAPPQPQQRAPQAPPAEARREPPQAPRRPQEPPQQPHARQSSIPEDAAPPERHTLPDREPEQPAQEPAPLDEQGIELPHEGDSFFDPSDPDAALAAETQRQAHLHAANLRRQREQKMARQRAEAMGMPTSAEVAKERLQAQRDAGRPAATRLDPRTAGLREAANTSDHVFDTGAGRQQTGRPQRAQPQAPSNPTSAPATLHGKPVYKMPTQTLDRSARRRPEAEGEGAEAPPNPVQINPTAGGRQSKFRGPTDQ